MGSLEQFFKCLHLDSFNIFKKCLNAKKLKKKEKLSDTYTHENGSIPSNVIDAEEAAKNLRKAMK